MVKVLRGIWCRLNKKTLQEDVRKFGVNLMAGSVLGGFVSHFFDMSYRLFMILLWIWVTGVIFILIGSYKIKFKRENY